MGKKIPFIIGIFLTFFALWVFLTSNPTVRHFIQKLDNLSYDLQIQAKTILNKKKDTGIAIIDVDDRSLSIEGQWPWQRSKLASLIDKISEYSPMALLLDVFFSEPQANIASLVSDRLYKNQQFAASCAPVLQQNLKIFDEDQQFADSLKKVNAVGAEIFLQNPSITNELKPALLTLTAEEAKHLAIPRASGFIANIAVVNAALQGAGFINVEPDEDGIVRRALLLVRYGDKVYPSIGLQGLLSIFNNKVTLISDRYSGRLTLEKLQLGVITIPTDAHGKVLIPWVARGSFPRFSATDVLHGKVKEDDLLGKIILLGTSAIGLGDFHATPIGSLVPGIFIQANVIKAIKENTFISVPAWAYGANFTFILLFGFLSAFLFPYFGPRVLGILIFGLPIVVFMINYFVWIKTAFIFSSLLPILTIISIAFFNIIYGYIFESRKREKLRDIFGQYVPEKHIDDMINSKDYFSLKGENRIMSVLFADIRNFTTISESIPAEEVVSILNKFFTPMTEIIFKYKGTIDKYVGDMLIAFWNAPLKDRRHISHSLHSAIDMSKQLKIINAEFKEKNYPEILIGIGVNTGLMAVGDMGSKFRRNYTVIGDAVNVGSRLETLTKFYGVDIIVPEITQRAVHNVLFKILDKVILKGKTIPIHIYEVIDYKDNIEPITIKEVSDFDKAWKLYQEQNWNEAEQIISKLSEEFPDKKLYKLYLERIKEFRENPPPSPWDGVFVHS